MVHVIIELYQTVIPDSALEYGQTHTDRRTLRRNGFWNEIRYGGTGLLGSAIFRFEQSAGYWI
jgi:hypothetical protein